MHEDPVNSSRALDNWTCPCGHEIDPDSGDCIVWTWDSWPHFVPDNSSLCRCHGYGLRDIERLTEKALGRML